ncbi:MAG: PAS domain-containing protein [Reyranella sp.]|nr:PAS domain-containing protein [Reyranella sp.]MBR2818032.1 PAS domain-containing protein [Reyranella sp.]
MVSPLLTSIFPGDSAMARTMRDWDWAATPLGPPETWPDGLKIPLRMLLTSRFEMWLGWGPDLHFFYNDAYVPTLGVKHPSMLGKPFREVWAEVYAEVADQVAHVRAGEATWNKALLLLLERSGYPEETYHSFSYSPLYGDSGAVEGLLCVVSEETERVIGERRIEMLRQLGMALVGTADLGGVEDAVCSILGANRRDFPFALVYLHGNGIACTPDARPLLERPWPQETETGQELRLDDRLSWPTGDWQRPPDEAIALPIPGAPGRPAIGSLVLGLNPHRRDDTAIVDIARLIAGQISGAMANVDARQSERRRAERIWSLARDLMVVADSGGIFRVVNPAWTRILGHPVENVIGRHFNDFVLADDHAASTAAYAQAAQAGDLTNFVNRLVTNQGGFRWISWHTSTEGDVVYAYGRDITEEKASADALATAEEALRHAQKMEAVGQLTGGIAHDFNNLLTGIIVSLEVVQRRIAQGRYDELATFAEAATGSANRAAALTQRLLAFSRRQPLAPKPLDADALIASMEMLIQRTVGETIEVACHTTPGLWPTKCDPNQLESSILNLVINARDAMPSGGRITVDARNISAAGRAGAAGSYIAISVADTGHGMSAETVSRAFDPFFTTKPIGQGTGLGLSMVYGFAQQSGGFVEIDSTEGKGTTVRICLPRCRDSAGPSASDAAPSVGRSAKSQIVLVVEDEPAVRAVVTETLREVGYETIEAVDGASGLRCLQSPQHIDLLLTDVGLPGGLNGRQLADAARTFRPDLKVLFMTGYVHDVDSGGVALEPGMEIITKPFTSDRLAAQVEAFIGI